MSKLKMVAVLALALGLGSASAQNLAVSGGASLGTGGTGFSVGVTAPALITLPGFDVDARVMADVRRGGFGVGADALAFFPGTGDLNFYAGPGVYFSSPGGFGLSLTGGLSLFVSDQLNAFAEGTFRVLGGFGPGLRAGVQFFF